MFSSLLFYYPPEYIPLQSRNYYELLILISSLDIGANYYIHSHNAKLILKYHRYSIYLKQTK
jgi:hypothetical protein